MIDVSCKAQLSRPAITTKIFHFRVIREICSSEKFINLRPKIKVNTFRNLFYTLDDDKKEVVQKKI